MIVVAIIGVLASALFPMVRVYLEKSRDAARIASLWQLRTVIQSFLQDIGYQPLIGSGIANNCVGNPDQSGWDISPFLNGWKVPLDPINLRTTDPCGLTGPGGRWLFWYATGAIDDIDFDNKPNPAFFVIAHVETSAMATTGSSVFTGSSMPLGMRSVDALLQINGQKWIALDTNPLLWTGYSVYVVGGMN